MPHLSCFVLYLVPFFGLCFVSFFCLPPDNYIVYCSRNNKNGYFRIFRFFLRIFAFLCATNEIKNSLWKYFHVCTFFGIFLLKLFSPLNGTKNLFHATKCFKCPNAVRKYSRFCICSSLSYSKSIILTDGRNRASYFTRG